MKDTDKIKESIIEACRWMEDMGLVFGTWGNISVKSGESIILTPTRLAYRQMTPADMVVIDLEGRVIEGSRLPTSEKELHRYVHVARQDVVAVVHNHSTYATAVACTGRDIPVMNEEMSQLLGGRINCSRRYVPAGKHVELAEECVLALGERNAALLRNHGVICCGADLEEALIACLIAEKAAKMYLAIGNIHSIQEIPDELVTEERYRYLHKYGKE